MRYTSWWQVWGRGASLAEPGALFTEQAGFKRVTNGCTYSHKTLLGAAVLVGAALTALGFPSTWWGCIAAAATAALVVADPTRVLYAADVPLTLALRTPEFLDADTHFRGHTDFVAAADAIIAETRAFVDDGGPLVPTGATFGGKNAYIGQNTGWRVHLVKVAGRVSLAAQSRLPALVAALAAHPEVVSCVISVLDPGVKIPMHVGYYKGVLRYMLAVEVPTQRDAVWLNVNGTRYHWDQGAGVLWDDTYPHAVYNTTAQRRVVLYMDVARTAGLPSWASALNRAVLWLIHASGIAAREVRKTETPQPIASSGA
jgi:hypothetical protein